MKRRLRNEILIHVDSARVARVVADAPRFFRGNPLVIDVTRDPDAAGAYHVSDAMKVLGATFRLRYRVGMLPVEGGFDFEAWAPLAIHLSTRLRLLARGDDTLVREDIELSAPGLLAVVAARTAAKAHQALLVNLKRMAEEGD
jgi:hypothetical protein